MFWIALRSLAACVVFIQQVCRFHSASVVSAAEGSEHAVLLF
jgi:hypothetical protein